MPYILMEMQTAMTDTELFFIAAQNLIKITLKSTSHICNYIERSVYNSFNSKLLFVIKCLFAAAPLNDV